MLLSLKLPNRIGFVDLVFVNTRYACENGENLSNKFDDMQLCLFPLNGKHSNNRIVNVTHESPSQMKRHGKMVPLSHIHLDGVVNVTKYTNIWHIGLQ